MGSVQRGIEVVEFACGIPHLLKGEYSENVGTQVDTHTAAPAGRRLRRHHAVQFPGDGAAVDVPDGDRLRQHLHPQALGEGAVGVGAAWRELFKEAGLPDGVLNVVHGDKVAVDASAQSPGYSCGVVRRLDADREVHLRDLREGTASACRRSAARRTTRWCCPTPTSSSPPTR